MANGGFQETYMRWRYKWSFQQFVAELLQKRWMEPVVPFTAAIIVILAFALLIPGYASVGNIASTGRQFGEFGFVAMAIAIVIISGGIDLSVGSIFAMATSRLPGTVTRCSGEWPCTSAEGESTRSISAASSNGAWSG